VEHVVVLEAPRLGGKYQTKAQPMWKHVVVLEAPQKERQKSAGSTADVKHVDVLEAPRMGGKDQTRAQPMWNTSSFSNPPEWAVNIRRKHSRCGNTSSFSKPPKRGGRNQPEAQPK